MNLRALINKVYEYIAGEYNIIKKSNASNQQIAEYNSVAIFFEKLKSIKTESELTLLINDIKNDYETRRKNKIPCDRISELLNILNMYFIPSKKEEVKNTEGKEINKKVIVAIGFKSAYLSNENTLMYLKITKIVKNRSKEFYSIKSNDPKSAEYKKNLYEALMARRNFITQIFQDEPQKLNASLQTLGFIEAMERQTYSGNKINEKDDYSLEEKERDIYIRDYKLCDEIMQIKKTFSPSR